MKDLKKVLEKNIKDVCKIIFGNSDLEISVFSKEESNEYLENQFDFICQIQRDKKIS